MCANKCSDNYRKQTPHLSRPNKQLILTLCCLYLVQGIPIGLLFHAVPTILRASNLSLQAIAMVSLAGLFWALKFLWASVIDNYWIKGIGRRKSWIIPMQLLMAAAVFSLSMVTIDPESIHIVIVILAMMSFAGSTQDIATDGFAVENSHKDYLGLINTIQMSGILIGLLISGPLTLVLFEQIGYQTTCMVLASLIIIALLPIVLWKENSDNIKRVKKASIKRFFVTPFATPSLILCSFATVYGVVILAISKFILVDLGWSMTKIGMLTGVAHLMMMLLGCMIAGIMIKRWGYRFILTSGLFMVILGGGLWTAIIQASFIYEWLIWLTTLIVGLGMGFVAVSTYTYSMRFAQQTDQPGTNVAVFQSVQTLCEIVFSSIAISLAGILGYSFVFAAGSCIALLCLIALFKFRYYSHFKQQLTRL